MAAEYRPNEIEKKWSEVWMRDKIYVAVDNDRKPKYYLLIEFPYPSGERLHVGHARSYSCLDAVARLRRMKGYNVLYPIGWDAFGLPAENYAIKTGIHPEITTKKNIANAKTQAISWGLSFDWDREINTTDPEYYRWTQWIFVQLYKKGLAYKSEIPVNWCPACKINLANEEVIDGNCERCGTPTERRRQAQWLLKITEYADRLLEDLKTVNFRSDIALQQINWIGKKEGAKVRFGEFEVFTTRLDTIYGVTFLAAAPEVVAKMLDKVPDDKRSLVEKYVIDSLNKGERERKQKTEKTGVDTGLKVTNPANGEEIPVWVAEYVMTDIGTGVIMGVPAHDERDFEFAKSNSLPIRQVVSGGTDDCYEGVGILMNSGVYSGIETREAIVKMVDDGLGEKTDHYHLRDWVFSRQHYWGEPIPMVFCSSCAKASEGEPNAGWVSVPEEDLPVKLPEVEKYQPTDTGESPLAHIESFVNTNCPKCGRPARRETDTMPNWAGSSWYFLRYIDPHCTSALASPGKLKYWLPVDWYNGGMEHTTLHLLYSRFWHKFLYDMGIVPTAEPYAKRTSHGVVLGPDGRKMSKSKGNVINPDDVVNKFGADTLRLYEMFMGPFDQVVAWSWESVEGVYRFLKRVWRLTHESGQGESSPYAKQLMSRLISKVESDLENMKFNTAVAAMMEWTNWWTANLGEVKWDMTEVFLKVLAPMAPFMTEELYQSRRAGEQESKSKEFISIHCQQWPEIADKGFVNGKVTVIVQVGGKVRGKLECTINESENQDYVQTEAVKIESVAKYTAGKNFRVVFVPGKLINLVIE